MSKDTIKTTFTKIKKTVVDVADKVAKSINEVTDNLANKDKVNKAIDEEAKEFVIYSETNPIGGKQCIRGFIYEERHEIYLPKDESHLDLLKLNSILVNDGLYYSLILLDLDNLVYQSILVDKEEKDIACYSVKYLVSSELSTFSKSKSRSKSDLDKKLDLLESDIYHIKKTLFNRKKIEALKDLFVDFRECVYRNDSRNRIVELFVEDAKEFIPDILSRVMELF